MMFLDVKPGNARLFVMTDFPSLIKLHFFRSAPC